MHTPNETLASADFKEIAATWDQSHKYSPAPRHRRRIILKLLNTITFRTCLDAGCAQPYLLNDIAKRYQAEAFGCDISERVIATNQQQFPQHTFKAFDLATTVWPAKQPFDLVLSSEVIEHIADWQAAIRHMAMMSNRYLLISVPSGKRRYIDYKLGHFRHYHGNELIAEIEKHGFKIIAFKRHGFPIHSLYKRLINLISPERMFQAFSSAKPYSMGQKLFAHGLYLLFFINYLFNRGDQLFVLAEKQ